MHLFEVLDGVNPQEMEDVIQRSFGDRVVSDLIADVSVNGDVQSHQIIQQIKQQFPSITKNVVFDISQSHKRIRIEFDTDGRGCKISVPLILHQELGEILILHELAHMLYTKDLLTNKIIKFRNSSEAFTVLRVLEDVAIERKMERDFPHSIDIFKKRASHAINAITQHVPTAFASEVDQMFLTLRGYTNRKYKGSTEVLRYAEKYLSSNNDDDKIDAVLNITDILTKERNQR